MSEDLLPMAWAHGRATERGGGEWEEGSGRRRRVGGGGEWEEEASGRRRVGGGMRGER